MYQRFSGSNTSSALGFRTVFPSIQIASPDKVIRLTSVTDVDVKDKAKKVCLVMVIDTLIMISLNLLVKNPPELSEIFIAPAYLKDFYKY